VVLSPSEPIRLPPAVAIAAATVVSFHLVYEVPRLAWMMGMFALCLVTLVRVRSTRTAFWLGIAVGLVIYAPQLWFFAGIFKAAAVALWLVIVFWLVLFLLMTRACLEQLPRWAAVIAIPVLWTGLEYFRSELYYLRFAWLNIGYAFSQAGPLLWPGVYGVGFAVMLAAALTAQRWWIGIAPLCVLVALTNLPPANRSEPAQGPLVVGIQLEHAPERLIRQALDRAVTQYPLADILMLSEYAFSSPPPPAVREWCPEHQKHLIAGGVQMLPDGRYRNTAFVIGPDGRIVFTQAKSVPIQFFADGLPADKQDVWLSPWGPIGICICYDLSYTRVTDRLIDQGAGAILVPTMDLTSWGRREHELHARIGPARAAEYSSQIITANGDVAALAGFPGQGELVAGHVQLHPHSRRPIDRWLVPACSGLSGLLAVGLAVNTSQRRWMRMRKQLAVMQDAV
jgi:apolipoprotein N-acyltransferase